MVEKKFIPAYMNHGRWLLNCGKCNTPLPADESGVVCPLCYPGMVAKYDAALPSPPYPLGATRKVADHVVIRETRERAAAAGDVYYPDHPMEKDEIELILRSRKVANMNWLPGETLDFLRRDNFRHGDPLPEGFISIDMNDYKICPKCGAGNKVRRFKCHNCGEHFPGMKAAEKVVTDGI